MGGVVRAAGSMVFVRDEGSIFRAPIEAVWEFVGSGDRHAGAHGHRNVRRERRSGTVGTYAWDQEFDGAPARFAMRWTVFPPLGIAYEVLEGPFRGSTFFLYYRSRGAETEVGIVGEFTSPTLAESELPAAVDRFFTKEYEQDRDAIERRA